MGRRAPLHTCRQSNTPAISSPPSLTPRECPVSRDIKTYCVLSNVHTLKLLGYGLGYRGYGGYYGYGLGHGYYYGKRSAEAEPEAKADPYLLYGGYGYGHGLGYGYGYGLGYRGYYWG